MQNKPLPINLNPPLRLYTRRAAIVLPSLILAAVVAWPLGRGDASETERAAAATGIEEAPPAPVPVEEFAVAAKSPPTPAPPPPPQAWQEFTPSEVIGSLDCSMLAGQGQARDAALVILPAPDGARFAALDGQGTLFGDMLPFEPNHYRLGRRADGTVLAGFGAFSLVYRDRKSPEPVRIYADGRGVLYETDKAWEFGIARDGSSFFAQEPLAGGGASRLIVHNLEQGLEHHFALGTKFTDIRDYESSYGTAYSKDAGEVMFIPRYVEEFGAGEHWFYPVDGGAVRRILVERGAPFDPVGDEAPKMRGTGAASMPLTLLNIPMQAAWHTLEESGGIVARRFPRGLEWRHGQCGNREGVADRDSIRGRIEEWSA